MSRARYIQSKVNPILENLVTEVLLERPDNPVPNLKVRCGAMLKQCSGVNNCPLQILAEVSLDIIKLSLLTVKECKRMRAATQHAIEQSMNQITGVAYKHIH